MGVSISTRQAYSEIDEFLGLLTNEQIDKIPQKLREFFKEEKDYSYKKGINPKVPIKEQNLKEETLGIIALLNLQYWCEDEQEKERLQKVYSQNEKKYQDLLNEKYNPNNLFKKNKANETIETNLQNENMAMVEYKEPIFKRILNKIKRLFHKL